MKESIGYTATLNIVIVFIVIIFAVFAMSLSYYRAYKVSNKITESIEKYEGYNYLSEAEIRTKLTALGYNFSSVSCKSSLGGCLLYAPTYEDDVDDSIKVSKYSGELGYCIYTCPGSEENRIKYKVTTNMMWNIPIVNNILNIPVETKTRELYGFFDIEMSDRYVFEYTGSVQEFVVPKTGIYSMEVWGAQGGRGCRNANCISASYAGGKGGYSYGEIFLTLGDTFYVLVGGRGEDANGVYTTSIDEDDNTAEICAGSNGGYNGGGSGGADTNCDYYHLGSSYNGTEPGAGGGGATDIRTIRDNLSSRIIVAGGGGGGSYYGAGGAGGGNQGGLTPTNDSVVKQALVNSYGIAFFGIAGGQAQKCINGSTPKPNNNDPYVWVGKCTTLGRGENGNGYTGGAGGAGGGYYGGLAGGSDSPGTGGSGYIANIFSNSNTQTGVNEGHGRAIITFLN